MNAFLELTNRTARYKKARIAMMKQKPLMQRIFERGVSEQFHCFYGTAPYADVKKLHRQNSKEIRFFIQYLALR